jgi:hypothetical protein
MPTSIEKPSGSPAAGSSSTFSSGSPTVATPDLITASSYHSGIESRTACSITASRPTRWITIAAGTFPLRKPGMRSSRPIAFAARSTRDSTSALGTCASRRTRESLSSVTLVVTDMRGTAAAVPAPGARAERAVASLPGDEG